MKVLFLNPPDFNKVSENIVDEKSQEYLESDDFGAFPPLGIMYVMAYLEKHAPHHKLYFKDCVAERYSHKMLNDYVTEMKPDIVAMTSFTVSMIDVVIAAQNIRKIVPNVHICLGGHHPIAFPFEAASLPEFDSIVVGEGELNDLSQGTSIGFIFGLGCNGENLIGDLVKLLRSHLVESRLHLSLDHVRFHMASGTR